VSFQIAIAQFQPQRKNVDKNVRTIQSLLAGVKADLVVLPELANSGYLYKSTDDLEPFSESNQGKGPFLSALQALAKSIGGIIVTGYSELSEVGIYNSSAAVSEDGMVANYRKIHLYSDEKNLFNPGDQGFKVFNWKGVKIGMMICFDWIFPEAARTLALQGAQIIAHPANLVLPYCQNAMVTRSIENRVFTITSNRIGKEKLGQQKLQFTGVSQITRPNGEILFRGPKNKTTVHITAINPGEALDKMISAQNNLIEDRRPSMYTLN